MVKVVRPRPEEEEGNTVRAAVEETEEAVIAGKKMYTRETEREKIVEL